MDLKTIFGKTLFFVMIVAFVAAFSVLFGEKNSLVGVMIIVAALMLMSRDMSSKIGYSFIWILGMNLCLGVGTFLSTSYPLIGILINFSLVFSLVFILAHDAKPSVEFPFLLGYALMMSVPVTLDELPLRLLSLFFGSVFIIVLNYLVHRKTSDNVAGHSGIVALLDMINDTIDRSLRNEDTDPAIFKKEVSKINSGIFDRLQKRFCTTPDHRSVMNISITLGQLGKNLCNEKTHENDLKDLKNVISSIKTCIIDKKSIDETHDIIWKYIKTHDSTSFDITSGLEIIDRELLALDSNLDTTRKDSNASRSSTEMEMNTSIREMFRLDSVAFSYALRLALMICLFEFIASYFDILAARWLTFTAIAITVPYVDRDAAKAKMRLKGALSGIALFTLLTLITTDYVVLTGIMLLLNYIYTLFDPLRYDIKMMFTNISALITAVLTMPNAGTNLEDAALRLACILLGTVIVMLCNRLLLPYHIYDVNIKLANRLVSLNDELLSDIDENGRKQTDNNRAAIVLSADLTSEKIRTNLFQCPDEDLKCFLDKESEVTTRCLFYQNISYKKTNRTIESEIDNGYIHSINTTKKIAEEGRNSLQEYLTKVTNGYKVPKNPYREF